MATVKLHEGHVAVLVIDMQNAFTHPEGSFAKLGFEVARIAAILPAMVTLLTAFQKKAIPTIFVQMGWAADYSDAGLLATHPPGPQLVAQHGLVRGTWDTAVAEALQAVARGRGAATLPKTRFSAFHGTDLEARLRAAAVDQVVVVGCLTNACVDASVRDAFCLGFECVVPRECVASVAEEAHAAALLNLENFGSVVGVQDLLNQLED